MSLFKNGISLLSEAVKSDNIYTEDVMADGCRSRLKEELEDIDNVTGEDDEYVDGDFEEYEDDEEEYEYPEEAVFIRESNGKYLIEYYDFHRYMKHNNMLDAPKYAFDKLVEYYSGIEPNIMEENTFILIESSATFRELIEESKKSKHAAKKTSKTAQALGKLKLDGVPLLKKVSKKKKK